tara:strand:- start:1385 stop:1660 length:276 start_codon:yes stop_codon:yes gene_type:complete
MTTIANQEKLELIKDTQRHDKDTGSSESQITLLTHRINHLVEHLKVHKKDQSTRRGLLILVGLRRRLIKYMQRKNPESLKKVAKSLKLKIK